MSPAYLIVIGSAENESVEAQFSFVRFKTWIASVRASHSTGLLAPAGTPTSIILRLNTDINASVSSPDMIASMAKLGFEPKIGSPQDFSALIVDEIEVWKTVAKSAGIVPE